MTGVFSTEFGSTVFFLTIILNSEAFEIWLLVDDEENKLDSHKTNTEVLDKVNEKRTSISTIKQRRKEMDWLYLFFMR